MTGTQHDGQPGRSRSALISAEELKSQLNVDKVKIFDVRGTWATPARGLREDYEAAHVPGAFYLDWTTHFLEPGVDLGLASICGEDQAKGHFSQLGIDEGDQIVLYDDYSHMLAGRIWLAMRYFGFKNVRILNGGWHHWSRSGLPVSSEVSTAGKGSYRPKIQKGLKVDIEDFLERQSEACVIDARSFVNFAGRPEDPRTGHIPGSLNIPYRALLDSDTGLFLSADDVSRVLDERAPSWRTKPVIATCGSGYAATVLFVALHDLGREAVVFDGSFAIWKQDEKRSVSQVLQSEP